MAAEVAQRPQTQHTNEDFARDHAADWSSASADRKAMPPPQQKARDNADSRSSFYVSGLQSLTIDADDTRSRDAGIENALLNSKQNQSTTTLRTLGSESNTTSAEGENDALTNPSVDPLSQVRCQGFHSSLLTGAAHPTTSSPELHRRAHLRPCEALPATLHRRSP
ncbi:hypothetical protein MRB53_040232 [Persea americana]|nr:hypothetical protein MRB53_040232 [Persea americana]